MELKAADLEAQFAEMDGWNAEADASQLLQSVGIAESMHTQKMRVSYPKVKRSKCCWRKRFLVNQTFYC